jgi:hypothetical protein
VEGFGAVGFPELRELLEAASDQQKQLWADKIAAMQYGPAQRLAAIALYAAWVQLDARAACESLRHFADPLTRMSTIDPVISAAPAPALPILAQMLRALSPFEQRPLLRGVMKQWASIDPAAAADFLAEEPNSPASTAEMPDVIAAWAQDDLQAARAWLEQSDAFRANSAVLSALATQWIKSDLEGAAEYVRARAASPGSYQALQVVTAELFRVGRDRAAAFIRSLPEETQATAVNAVFRLVQTGAVSEIGEAVSWASQLPLNAVAEPVRHMLAAWISDDPDSATDWLKQRPAAERAQLVVELCRTAPVSQSVVQLALSLPDAERRGAAVRALATRLPSEPERLRAAVAAFGLPPAEAAYLLRLGGVAQ